MKRFTKDPNSLVDYLYIDQKRLNSYSEQIKYASKTSAQGSFSIAWTPTGPSGSIGGGISTKSTSNHERITKLLKYLKRKELIITKRPTDIGEFISYPNSFFYETFTATKLILDLPKNNNIHGLNALAFWISYPKDNPIPKNKGNYYRDRGMFLHLLESYWASDENGPISPYSGYTAPCRILKEISHYFGIDLKLINAHLDINQRDSSDTIKILENVGFVAQPERKITALYQKRYISDDKFTINKQGEIHRCWDLFAYPIFIASEM